jgi:hypothetical protein
VSCTTWTIGVSVTVVSILVRCSISGIDTSGRT